MAADEAVILPQQHRHVLGAMSNRRPLQPIRTSGATLKNRDQSGGDPSATTPGSAMDIERHIRILS
jgi:hypothetical protein